MAPPPRAGVAPRDAEALAQVWNTAQRKLSALEEGARVLGYQRDLFARADSLVLVRIDRLAEIAGMTGPGAYLNGLPQVVLQPVQWVKGKGGSDMFTVSASGLTSCGPMPGYDVLRGQPGDVFALYLTGQVAEQQHLLGTVAIAALIEPEALKAILAAQQ